MYIQLGLTMITRILRWGNSLGLRIPKSFALQAGVKEGSSVDISMQGSRIIIRPVTSEKYRLEELVSQIRKDNLHKEITSGKSVGQEVW